MSTSFMSCEMASIFRLSERGRIHPSNASVSTLQGEIFRGGSTERLEQGRSQHAERPMMRRVGALPEERHAVRRGLYNVLFLQKQN